jgi:SAM-dependent methyltransferase
VSTAKVRALSERLYPDYRSESDRLHEAITRYLPERGTVLDVGCGGGKLFPHDYRAAERRVVGLDLDPAIWTNERVDQALFASAERIPLADASVDLAFSRYVFEHLPDPGAVFAEIERVLRPGGIFIVLTPNVFHYVPLVSRLTPGAFHRRFNARARGRAESDTFPTLYRANSRPRLRRLARGAGLEEAEVAMIETRPNYLMWSLPAFLLGVAYERLVNSAEIWRDVRVNILGVYRKPAAGGR